MAGRWGPGNCCRSFGLPDELVAACRHSGYDASADKHTGRSLRVDNPIEHVPEQAVAADARPDHHASLDNESNNFCPNTGHYGSHPSHITETTRA